MVSRAGSSVLERRSKQTEGRSISPGKHAAERRGSERSGSRIGSETAPRQGWIPPLRAASQRDSSVRLEHRSREGNGFYVRGLRPACTTYRRSQVQILAPSTASPGERCCSQRSPDRFHAPVAQCVRAPAVPEDDRVAGRCLVRGISEPGHAGGRRPVMGCIRGSNPTGGTASTHTPLAQSVRAPGPATGSRLGGPFPIQPGGRSLSWERGNTRGSNPAGGAASTNAHCIVMGKERAGGGPRRGHTFRLTRVRRVVPRFVYGTI